MIFFLDLKTLVKLFKDEMKDELLKMGSELVESVEEILQKVEQYKRKYTLSNDNDIAKNNDN